MGQAMSLAVADDMRIAIVGSGAVGCYYGGRLAVHGCDVRFLMRGDFDHVQANGLNVSSCDGDFELPSVRCFRSTEEIGPCDLVIIALKATANGVLPSLLPPLLKDETIIITLENGLGSDVFLAEHFGAERVIGGLCFVCINRTAPGVIVHSSQGLISLGEFTGAPKDRTQRICQLFQASGIPCKVVSSLELERWRKLVWNVPFNGLSIAAGGIDVSQILASPGLVLEVRALMGEVVGIAAKLGHVIGEAFVDENIDRTTRMGAYQPSSLIDYLNSREVETEAIWGEPVRLAKSIGVACPRLELLYHLLTRLTQQARDHRRYSATESASIFP